MTAGTGIILVGVVMLDIPLPQQHIQFGPNHMLHQTTNELGTCPFIHSACSVLVTASGG